MGFFDLFKSKKEKQTQIIVFTDIPKWIADKKEEIDKNEKKFLITLIERINYLIKELERKYSVLEKVSLDDKKAEEKLKLIVRENSQLYLSFLRKLIINLDSIHEKNLDPNELIKEINNTISDFKQRSDIAFQKSTILIGNEIGSINDSILEFSYDFGKILRENEEFLNEYNSIIIIEETFREIDEFNMIHSNINSGLFKQKERAKLMKYEESIMQNKINEIKQSEEYKKELKYIDEIEELEKERKRELNNLRAMIDFKELSSEFHTDSKKMRIINNFKEDFAQCFEEDKCISLMALLHEAKINIAKLPDKIHEIVKIGEKLNSRIKKVEQESFEANKIKELEFKLRIKKIDIENIENELAREEKKLTRFDENKQELLQSLGQEMGKMNTGLMI